MLRVFDTLNLFGWVGCAAKPQAALQWAPGVLAAPPQTSDGDMEIAL